MKKNENKPPYPVRKKRAGWSYYTNYCPDECIVELKQFYKQWREANIHRWAEPEVESE